MHNITIRQQEILNYIKKQIREKGYPPSVREIAHAVGLNSASTVHGHLNQLEKMGYLRRDPSKPRAIEILHDGRDGRIDKELITVPMLGRIAAGHPVLAVENFDDVISLPRELIGNRGKEGFFMLTVEGDSMIEAGIFEGDQVIVHSCSTANNGDIVVALLKDEATVKRFFKEDNYIRLQPENSQMEAIYSREVEILGRVVGLYRKF